MRQFKEFQARAKSESLWLCILLGIAIIATVLLSAAAVTYIALLYVSFTNVPQAEHDAILIATFAIVTFLSSVIVGTGTGIKLYQLRRGGRVIAEDLGARKIESPKSNDERQLVNVVEEISIASGVAKPEIYVLDGDPSINAFAAGYSEQDAVLGITSGSIKHLSRDQLQGVVAHEFGHILNGDMRLNLQMVGWLHGVLSITIVAEYLLVIGKELMNTGCVRNRPYGLALAMIIFGGCLWPVGIIGWLMSLMVKAATNRQREFLADAFAVQFTRHPEALADAFKRLVGHEHGSRVRSPKAIEASHLFLAEGCGGMANLLASHPPLVERIRRLDPSWDGTPLFDTKVHTHSGTFHRSASLLTQPDTAAQASSSEVGSTGSEYEQASPNVPPIANTEFAKEVLASLPEPFTELITLKGGAILMLKALWQARGLSEAPAKDPNEKQNIAAISKQLAVMAPEQQLTLFDLSITRVRANPVEREALSSFHSQLKDHRGSDELFLWMVKENLHEVITATESPNPRYGKLGQIEAAVEIILSHVSQGCGSAVMAGFSFQRALAATGLENIRLLEPEELDWSRFQTALEIAAMLAPQPKHQLLVAISAAITSDQDISEDEVLLVRLICSSLGYPEPPLLPGQPVAVGV
jgi:Zn-dependent protease with chaperone function